MASASARRQARHFAQNFDLVDFLPGELGAVRDGLGLCDYLELARFSKGRAPNPDVIVSDSDLSGYDGARICEQLSHEQASIPFILIGTGDLPDNSGAVQLLQKPVNLNELLEAVAGCTHRDSSAAMSVS